jgi:outer membrane protein assembly factor BamA
MRQAALLLVCWTVLACASLRAEETSTAEVAEPVPQAPADGEAQRTLHIVAIRFSGNAITREEVLRQELDVHEGDVVSPAQLEMARQAIMDLGLFEWVRADLEEVPGGEAVTFVMKEKFYFLPIPLVNGDPSKGDYSYGLELRADNLGGWNQTVKLKYETEQSDSDTTPLTRSGSINYAYPRLGGGPYNLSLGYSLSQEDFNVLDGNGDLTAKYHRNITGISGGLSRWLVLSGPSNGWSGGMGLSYKEQAYQFLSGVEAPYVTEQAVSMTAAISFSDVHDKGYYFTGSAYGWKGELGDEIMGSDFDFTRHLFYYRTYYHHTPRINLNWQLRIGFADGHPFGDEAYSIGGFSTLRGYQTEIDGNALALSNFEYQHQLDSHPSVRGVWFLDVGNAYAKVGEMDPGKLEAGTGVGLRWRIQSLVNVTLSADAAYGIGPGKTVFYLMTTSTF